jgi:hypothetical protein
VHRLTKFLLQNLSEKTARHREGSVDSPFIFHNIQRPEATASGRFSFLSLRILSFVRDSLNALSRDTAVVFQTEETQLPMVWRYRSGIEDGLLATERFRAGATAERSGLSYEATM